MTVGRSLRQIAIVIRKEIKDSLRDRRALWSIVFSVSIGPVIIGFMMNRVADRQREAEQVRVPVVGMQYAPALVEWLRQQSGVDRGRGAAGSRRSGPQSGRRADDHHPEELRREVQPVAAGAAADRRRQLAQRRAPDGRARASSAAAVRRGDRQPPPHRAGCQSGGRSTRSTSRTSRSRRRSSARRRS